MNGLTPNGKPSRPGATRRRAPANDVSDYLLEIVNEIARGNLAVRVDPSRAPQNKLLGAIAAMVHSLEGAFGELVIGSSLVDRSSSTMHLTAKSVRDNADQIRRGMANVLSSTEEMHQNMNSVSASAEELSVNMQSIAAGARQSNENIDSIQRSIQELTTASKEIAGNSTKATAISKEAMASVAAAFALVKELTAAAKEIDLVTAAISEISDQTKLLALNATIEAARAGEMGKGFAVVAREVKDLASQTNTATKDIQSKIGIIHTVTARSVEAMSTIDRVMRSVNESITSIAAAAEEQSVTTNDIAQNVVDATERIKEMSNNVGEGAVAVKDVSKSILGATRLAQSVAGSIRDLGSAGNHVSGDAVTAYAQAMEVTSNVGAIARRLRSLTLPDRISSAAEDVPLELCRFSEDFSLGVDFVNDDHRRIFGFVNTVHARLKEKAEPSQLLPIIKELAEFTRAHFAREEEAMTRANYPELPQHRKAHAKLLGQVAENIRNLEAGKEVDLIELLGFLGDWLTTHILRVDKAYGPSLSAAGIR